MPNEALIQHHLRDHSLENENLAGVVASATSNGDDTYLGEFVEDLGRAPWFRAIVERWPMLGSEIWSSPEIMEAQPNLDQARTILLRDGASRVNSTSGETMLHPVGSAVLDWLEGRRWTTAAAVERTLPIAIDALRVLGPEALPATEEDWGRMVRALDAASNVLDQLGSRPAQMLGAEGLRNLMAVAEARMDPASPGGIDGDLAVEIARFAFGPAGDDLVDDLKTDGDRVVYAEAVERMPIPAQDARLQAPRA